MMKTLLTVAFTALVSISACAQGKIGKEVYKDNNVVINQLDEHTWIGRGNLCYNESVYLVEGNEKAMLIDAGTKIPGLRKIMESITKKPVTLYLTHLHGDHTGAAPEFDKICFAANDSVILPPGTLKQYKGKMKFLKDGQKINLGGRVIDVIFTPGHTLGSVTFIDKKNGYGISGDAFGSTNLLLMTNFTTLKNTCNKILPILEKNNITFMYPGHFGGSNLETIQRVKDLRTIAEGALSGKIKGKVNPDKNYNLNNVIDMYGVKVNYADSALK